jgi:hypothetical protein
MTLTILAIQHDVSIDVVVKPEQRIKEVLFVLASNFRLPFELATSPISIYSRRRKRYVNEMLTFKQGSLYTGDVLEIKSHDISIENEIKQLSNEGEKSGEAK